MVSDCKSLEKKKGIEVKRKKKKGGRKKKDKNEEIIVGEKGENAKWKREKAIMYLFSEERSYIQEVLLVSFVGL